FTQSACDGRPPLEDVVPVETEFVRPVGNEAPISALVGLACSGLGEIAPGVVIEKEVELTDALGNRDETEALVAERSPARNLKQLHRRKRCLDALGQAQHPLALWR